METSNEEQTETLQLVLVGKTTGIFASLIKAYTKTDYIHIILGLDKDLKYCYSYGRRYPAIPVISGFEREELDKVVKVFPKVIIRVTEITCTPAQKKAIQSRIDYYYKKRFKYHYCILGLPFLLINRPFHQKRHYTCSQFVGKMLLDHKIMTFDKHYTLLTPKDFMLMAAQNITFEGTVQDFIKKNW